MGQAHSEVREPRQLLLESAVIPLDQKAARGDYVFLVCAHAFAPEADEAAPGTRRSQCFSSTRCDADQAPERLSKAARKTRFSSARLLPS
jgi:hypothetical protein